MEYVLFEVLRAIALLLCIAIVFVFVIFVLSAIVAIMTGIVQAIFGVKNIDDGSPDE